MSENLFKNDHPELALSLGTLAAIHRSLGNHTQADQYEVNARATRERLFPRWSSAWPPAPGIGTGKENETT